MTVSSYVHCQKLQYPRKIALYLGFWYHAVKGFRLAVGRQGNEFNVHFIEGNCNTSMWLCPLWMLIISSDDSPETFKPKLYFMKLPNALNSRNNNLVQWCQKSSGQMLFPLLLKNNNMVMGIVREPKMQSSEMCFSCSKDGSWMSQWSCENCQKIEEFVANL